MSAQKKLHEDIRFSQKKPSLIGFFSVLFSAASIVLFFADVWISFRMAGKAGTLVGALGMLALIIGLIGWVCGLSERRNDEVNQTLPKAGVRLGFLSVLIWAAVIVLGLIS